MTKKPNFQAMFKDYTITIGGPSSINCIKGDSSLTYYFSDNYIETSPDLSFMYDLSPDLKRSLRDYLSPIAQSLYLEQQARIEETYQHSPQQQRVQEELEKRGVL